MDRYVFREKRVESEPQGNQMISFSATSAGNIPLCNVYYGNMDYDAFHNVQRNSQYRAASHQPQMQLQQNRPIMSGIDPRYLSSYSDKSAPAVVFGQQNMSSDMTPDHAFGNYQNRIFIGPERNGSDHYQKRVHCALRQVPEKSENSIQKTANAIENQPKPIKNFKTTKKQEVDLSKNEEQYQVKTRSEKLKELHKIGTRVFSGPVEKILKWNKAVQDIGAMVLYEIVGKCVSVRPEKPFTKNLVVRDESGPAMQVVYYEIDFLLPELKVPCMISIATVFTSKWRDDEIMLDNLIARVIGRIMPGTCRLQAFSVRAATGDDIAILPRRAAVAAHHVAKLCKDYGQ